MKDRVKIDTVFSEEYYADTDTASMRKLTPVAKTAESKGYANLVEPYKYDIIDKLKKLHDPDYVNSFDKGIRPLCNSQGWDWTKEIRNGVFAINRGQLTAAKLAFEKGISANVAQGFHHAGYRSGCGFCTFNGLALVANEYPQKNVFVLDCDQHGGNGTQEFIGRKLNNLEQITINGSNFGCYEGIPEKSICITLSPITKDWSAYEEALEFSFEEITERSPDLVIYQAGADPHIDDPLGSLGMTTEQMRERDRLVFEFLSKSGLPSMFVLAGGYQEPIETELVPLHVNTFEEASSAYTLLKNNKELTLT